MRHRLCLIYISISLLFILARSALAQGPDYDRVNEIAKGLNCPTCAGINLADCRTQTCAQWKEQIGDLVQEGYSDQEVLDYFVAQYGAQVLQEPPRSGFTLVLWILPIVALLAGGGWLVYTIRGWTKSQPAPVADTLSSANNVTDGSSPQATDTADDYLSQVEKDLGIEET